MHRILAIPILLALLCACAGTPDRLPDETDAEYLQRVRDAAEADAASLKSWVEFAVLFGQPYVDDGKITQGQLDAVKAALGAGVDRWAATKMDDPADLGRARAAMQQAIMRAILAFGVDSPPE